MGDGARMGKLSGKACIGDYVGRAGWRSVETGVGGDMSLTCPWRVLGVPLNCR